jgi:hypothetical protein
VTTDRSLLLHPDVRPLPRWLIYAFAIEAVVAAAIGVLLVDMAMHRAAAERDGLNRWGYRGSIARARRPGEQRMVFVGGSAAFGLGTPLDETIPKYLERNLQQKFRMGYRAVPVTVVNLAAVPDDAASFRRTLNDYRYIDYDIVCFYDGYNSLGSTFDEEGWRRQSATYRHTGYLPILPFVITGASPIGRPRLATGGPAVARASVTSATTSTCGPTWERYCEAMRTAVGDVIDSGRTAIVVTPPSLSAAHADQQHALAADLFARFGDRPTFRYLDFGSTVDLRDRDLSSDGVHLTARGNDRIADSLTGPVLQLLR